MNESKIPLLADFSPQNNPQVKVFSGGYTLSNLRTVLSVAREHKFGVIAVNQRSPHIIQASLEAAWQEKSPIILECAESEASYCNMPPERMSQLVFQGIEAMIAKYNYTVPVVLHQDHVQKDLTLIDRAAASGFSSVEVDLSRLPLEENIKGSMEIVKKMHPLGISVEVEEGEIGFASALKDFEHVEKYYTKVEDALALVEATRPEALAIFVGNGHGNYVDDPRIGLERIQEIVRAVEPYNVAVVLHGGSGLKPEFFRKVVAAGAAKFNYATSVSDILFKYFPQDLKDKMTQLAAEKGTEFRKTLKYVENDIDALDPVILEQARQAMTDHIRFMMREAFGSQGKSVLYS